MRIPRFASQAQQMRTFLCGSCRFPWMTALARASRSAISTANACSGGQQRSSNNRVSLSTMGDMTSTVLETSSSTFQVKSGVMNSHGGSSNSFRSSIAPSKDAAIVHKASSARQRYILQSVGKLKYLPIPERIGPIPSPTQCLQSGIDTRVKAVHRVRLYRREWPRTDWIRENGK